MLGFALLVLHVVIYSSLGIAFYALRSRLSLIPFYLFLGTLQVYVSLMSSFYVIDIGFGIQVGGGNIVYSAVIWSVMLFYIMERDTDLTKMVIYSLTAIQIIFILVYPMFYLAIESDEIINPLLVPSEIFQTSFGIFVVGNLLALLELIAMVFVLQRLSQKYPRIPPVILVILTYIMTLLADGVLFPLFAFPITQSISVVQGISSVLNKLVLGVLFSLMMFIAIQILGPKFATPFTGAKGSISEIFRLPKRDVIAALHKAEENRRMIRLLMSLLGHDLSNYNQSLLLYLGMIEKANLGLDEETLAMIHNSKQMVWESTNLVNNILSLNKVQDAILVPEPVDVSQLFDKALERTKKAYAYKNIIIHGREHLQDVYALAHPLLSDVFYNVLSNAIKHNHPNMTEITIDLIVQEKGRYWIIGLADNGPGIPDSMKTTIFELQNAGKQQGLGLSLVKTILQKIRSDIWVENRPESPEDHTTGAVFYIKMPKSSRRI